MRFDPQANYVPHAGSRMPLHHDDYLRGGSGFLRLFGRFLALLVVAAVGGAGWWFWTQSVAAGGPGSDSVFDLASPQLVPWRPDDRVMRAYQAGLSSEAAGRHGEAVGHFAEAVVLSPDFAEGHYRLGLAYARTGDYAAARAEKEKLQELNPSLALLLADHLP